MYEPKCIVCQQTAPEGLTCFKCKQRFSPEALIMGFEFKGITREVILNSKYRQKQYSLIKDLTNYMFDFKEQFNLHILKDFIVCPVPPDLKRLQKRGFSLPEIIGKNISTKLSLPYIKILKKVVTTNPLHKMDREERLKAVSKNFSLVEPPEDKILLVDDIVTTGATMLEASKILKKGGAKQVVCLGLTYRPLYSNS